MLVTESLPYEGTVEKQPNELFWIHSSKFKYAKDHFPTRLALENSLDIINAH